jgi:hypothetical protein
MLLVDLLATLKKLISMQRNMFIDMLKVLLNLKHFFPHEDNASSIRWVDANWAHDLDNRKSTTWMFFKIWTHPTILDQ